MFVASKGIAVRMFTDEVNRSASDNVMFSHAGDFVLFELGLFDNVSGVFLCSDPVVLCQGGLVKV